MKTVTDNLYCAQVVCELPVTSEILDAKEVLKNGAYFFEVDISRLRSANRQADLVNMRHMIIAVIYNNCGVTLQQVGRLLNRHHTSIISALKKVNNMLKTEEQFRYNYNKLNEFIKSNN